MTVQRWDFVNSTLRGTCVCGMEPDDVGEYVVYADVARFLPVPLTADSEEPPVGSVVLDDTGTAWQLGKGGLWWIPGSAWGHTWAELLTLGPVTLIWRGGE
ncbi:MAG: hypothetical protein Q8M17_10655 [Actinomycetota bacterium]|nr:hypothetical protein [Actinomycetota bacterium]